MTRAPLGKSRTESKSSGASEATCEPLIARDMQTQLINHDCAPFCAWAPGAVSFAAPTALLGPACPSPDGLDMLPLLESWERLAENVGAL